MPHLAAAVASTFVLAAAALAAPPTGKTAPTAAAALPLLTREQVNRLPAKPSAVQMFHISVASAATLWRGPDLVVEPPPMGMVGHPADAQCADYPDMIGGVYYWGVRNAGGKPTTGRATVTLTCDVMPPSLPPATRQAYDQRLCGCMRKTYVDGVPALQPGEIYGKQPSQRTLLSFISWPGDIPSCSDATSPWAKVVVRVVPRPEEGLAVGNNDRVVQFCIP
ncbi:MAG TPA: hypothetical protein VMT19_04575 [Thermoanaerobaculaceae bacterium]|nr:hypothetical protein [Thermoanaerobaculaceae bacterium]